MTKRKVLLSWSGGKDSALALHGLLCSGNWEVVGLLTTVTEGYDRISMHGVRRDLLERQAEMLGLPLEIVCLKQDGNLEDYEQRMKESLACGLRRGVESVSFGDLFLDDVRRYRQEKLAGLGMTAVFPLWGQNTTELADTFIRLGFKAIITCIDATALAPEFVGRDFDAAFVSDLPDGVDPCGERGEFHSFVYDGPVFREPICFEKGQVVVRDDRFHYCDLVPPQGKNQAQAGITVPGSRSSAWQ